MVVDIEIGFEGRAEGLVRSHADNEQRLRAHVLPSFKDIAALELTTGDVQTLVATKSRERSPRTGKKLSSQTVNHVLKLIKQVLNAAVSWGLIDRNVAQAVRPLPIIEVDYEVLSAREIERLLGAAPLDLQPLFFTALHTACRRGELCGLRWGDVDMRTGWITVRRSYSTPTKSGRIKRLPMTPQLRERLRWWRSQWSVVSEVKREPAADDVVFPVPGRSGQRRSRNSKYGFRTRLLDATRGRIGRFHALRHTAATLMVQAGIDMSTVQEVLGHSSVRVTEKYRHLQDSHKVAQMSKLSINESQGISAANPVAA